MEKCYIILLDSEFSVVNKLINKDIDSFNIPIFGKLGEHHNKNFIPVLFDLNDVQSIANRIIDRAISLGNIKSDFNDDSSKFYPVFGAIIVELSYNGQSIYVDHDGKSKLDYSKLQNNNSNLVKYKAKMPNNVTVDRGVLFNLDNISVTGLKYWIKTTIDTHVGFCILNSLSLTASEIRTLKKLYDTSKSNNSLNSFDSINFNNIPFISVGNLLHIKEISNMNNKTLENQDGGNENYKNLYKQEKTKYLAMKHAKSQGVDVTGEVDWNNLYRKEKNEYLMKKYGGSANLKELYEREKAKYESKKNQQKNDEYYKQEYKNKKAEYLALKLAQQSGEVIKGGNVDWNKLYRKEKEAYLMKKYSGENADWKKIYEMTKAKYLEKKNKL